MHLGFSNPQDFLDFSDQVGNRARLVHIPVRTATKNFSPDFWSFIQGINDDLYSGLCDFGKRLETDKQQPKKYRGTM
jgi:hypothetical protein